MKNCHTSRLRVPGIKMRILKLILKKLKIIEFCEKMCSNAKNPPCFLAWSENVNISQISEIHNSWYSRITEEHTLWWRKNNYAWCNVFLFIWTLNILLAKIRKGRSCNLDQKTFTNSVELILKFQQFRGQTGKMATCSTRRSRRGICNVFPKVGTYDFLLVQWENSRRPTGGQKTLPNL